MSVKPKKYLGQHFLIDKNIAFKIVNALNSDISNTIIEIGPGKGVLTEFFVQKNAQNYYAIDLDKESVDYLMVKYSECKDRIVHGDFLKDKILDDKPKPIAIIGNLPYNISSQIMFKIIDHIADVNQVVCMVQKEVAERLASPPGSKTYGILSVLLQVYFNIEYLFTVNEHVFYPRPKVKSAVIKFLRKENFKLHCDEKLFRTIVKMGFGQRRKMLRNSLKPLLKDIDDNKLFNMRPEQLAVADFIKLTNLISVSAH